MINEPQGCEQGQGWPQELTLVKFYIIVAELDHNRCRNCGCHTEQPAHHILLLSQGGKNWIINGILLCLKCHEYAHGRGNLKTNGIRTTARQFIIMVLDKWLDTIDYRWAEVHESLMLREGITKG